MKRTISSILIVLGAVSLLAGCSAVGKAPPELDVTAKELRPEEGEALVYVIRPSNLGKSVRMKVNCDGVYLGSTGGKRYIYALLEEGPHLFTSKAEKTSELPLVLEGGETCYLEQKIKMGLFKARNNLERIEDEEGARKLDGCALSKDVAVFASSRPPGGEKPAD